MRHEEQPTVFDEKRAATYDKRAAQLAPLRDSLHLLTRLILAELPAGARILCVGAGTGLELLYLAQEFPGWHFTAVEPASAMIETCRKKAEACGISARCSWHEGYLDSLPSCPPFDAAISFLVSHFIMQREERINFFGQIAGRLTSRGYLVSADLASDRSTDAYLSLREVWTRMLQYAGYSDPDVEAFLAAHGREVAVLPPVDVANLIESAGFEQAVPYLQTLFIHAWYARRAV